MIPDFWHPINEHILEALAGDSSNEDEVNKEREAAGYVYDISPIHTFVNIPALIRKRSVFLSSRAGILTKV